MFKPVEDSLDFTYYFQLKEERRLRQPSRVDNDILRSTLDRNPCLITRALAKKLDIHHSTAKKHIKHIGFAFVLKQSI